MVKFIHVISSLVLITLHY
jgi:E1A/CREB-binding protein